MKGKIIFFLEIICLLFTSLNVEAMTLTDTILIAATDEENVSDAKSEIERKGEPDFNEMAPSKTFLNYSDNLPERINTIMASSRNMSSYSSRYYTYADSYEFNEETGTYTLVNPTVGKYSLIYSSLGGKYVVSYSGSTSSSAKISTDLSMIYYITSSTTSSKLYYISSDAIPNYEYDYTKDGMYASLDDYGTSYYYRGAIENNYVNFAGYLWRIIRVNGDGTVRLIMEDSLDYSYYNEEYNSPKYVGYTYGNDDSSIDTIRINDNDSTIKEFIDNWYQENILDTEYEDYLSDTLFCNDRSLSTDYTWSNFIDNLYGEFSSYQRLNNTNTYSPTLKCSDKLDRYTVSDEEVGNGYLTYPVALITADEVIMAGNVSHYIDNEYNQYYYLYKEGNFWTMTPTHFNTFARLWSEDYGFLGSYSTDCMHGVRPVINIASEIVASSGTGIESDPYVLSLPEEVEDTELKEDTNSNEEEIVNPPTSIETPYVVGIVLIIFPIIIILLFNKKRYM